MTPVLKRSVNQGTPDLSKSLVVRSTEKNSKLLTPCRRVGLKRKSIASGTKKQLLVDCPFGSPNNENSSMCNDNMKSIKSKLSDQNIEEPSIDMNHKKRCPNDIDNNESSPNVNDCIDSQEITSKEEKIVESCANYGTTINELPSTPITLEVLDSLANSIKTKKDRYKQSQLASLYEKKHDIQKLKDLTDKWKLGCQSALLELLKCIQDIGYTLRMSQLLAQMQIPHDSVGYSEETEDFE